MRQSVRQLTSRPPSDRRFPFRTGGYDGFMDQPGGYIQTGDTPYDADGRVDVPDAPGWQYVTIHGHPDDALAVELAGPDEARIGFTVPRFLTRGDELGEVARIVIRAFERQERTAGVGG